MSDLTVFLLARIAEDEVDARKASEVFPSPWEVSDRGHTAYVRSGSDPWWDVAELGQHPALPDAWMGDYLQHVARHDPARVLAECEAKRRIVEDHEPSDPFDGKQDCGRCIEYTSFDHAEFETYPCPTLRLLALPYGDHPDYRDEWCPS